MGMMLIGGSHLPPPAKCISCGDTDRDCVDFGVTEEYYGAVLICILCLRSAMLEWPIQMNVVDKNEFLGLSQDHERLTLERDAIPLVIEDVRNELFDIINSLSDRIKRYSEQFSDDTSDDPNAPRTLSLAKDPERQIDSDAGDEITFGISGRTGNGSDPFSRTDF